MIKILRKKLLWITLIITIIVITVIVKTFLPNEGQEGEIFIVKKTDVIEAISETGTIKRGEQLELSFETSGVISNIFVEEGQKVEKGKVLAQLNSSQLHIQLKQAEADLALAQSQLDKLLAGVTQEEINLAEIKVKQAEEAYNNAQIALENTQKVAQDQLDSDYKSALTNLEDALLKLSNASIFASNFQRTYFYRGDQISLIVKYKAEDLNNIYNELKGYVDEINNNLTHETIDYYLPIFKDKIYQAKNDLDIIREKTEDPLYRDAVSSADKTSLENHRSYLSTAYANISSSISTITLRKSLNKQSIAQAQQSVDAAFYQLKQAKEELVKLTSSPRKEDIEYYQAKIQKAQAQIELLKDKIQKTKIISPVSGIVAEIKKQTGETIQLFEPVFIILPEQNYYVEVNIYEEDLPLITIGDKVQIEIIAYPQKQIEGEVSFISPKEILINDVVYYSVKISFDPSGLNIKPGMSVDVSIITREKKNVLAVPSNSLTKENGRYYVLLKRGNQIEKVEVKTGLWGLNDLVEITEGLSENDEIIIE